MKLTGGYITLARLRGAPIRLHVSVLLVGIALGVTRHAPALIAYIAVLLVHELGHVAVALASRQRILNLDVHALGGQCLWTGPATARQRALIAWGGIVAQLALLVATGVAFLVAPSSRPWWAGEVAAVLVGVNSALIAINLLPMAALDGAEAWLSLLALAQPPRLPPARPRIPLPPAHRSVDTRRSALPPPPPIMATPTAAPSAKKKPVIQVIRARSASELLRELDAEEDRGNLPDVRDLVDQIFKKTEKRKKDLPN